MTESGMLARVVFDESHSEAWTVRPELARQMQPAHPGDASYARAAAALEERDFVVGVNADAALSEETLGGAGGPLPCRIRRVRDDEHAGAAERLLRQRRVGVDPDHEVALL